MPTEAAETPAQEFGERPGAGAPRGEPGALIVSFDSLLRMSSNSFFPYVIGGIEEGIGPAARTAAAPARL
jgi:hypothetical protein